MSNHKFELDHLDFAVLARLQEDGRKSFTDIAEELGVAVGTIRNRYHKLVQENILHIIGWTDPVQAGYHAYARVNIAVRPSERIRMVADAVLKIPEVTFLAVTSGNYDLEVNLLCKDNLALLDIMSSQIHTIEGVYETNTTVYFEVLKWASHDVSNALREKAQEVIKQEIKFKS
ncbi:MAG: Lrp/AsnC family transcriptional regulator [Saprospiraceae bacterium]|jgi:Lrp/AsnC family transcriptional regulator, regulator for asnA, asnC and gidA|nr:Lrp/AsnC family transcriptional regulator [Saprospiraceae bacterium]MDP4821585.1 Lrp/AsnC family transcriptional regulator [Saprospiraceae bacterium]MDP4999878.1 Lrp/AsnC family transcriptional regulator [Saprospiraceae bacterium]